MGIKRVHSKRMRRLASQQNKKREVLNELRETIERFNQLTNISKLMAWEVDVNGKYTYVSRASQEILGYSPEEMVGKMCYYDLFPSDAKESLMKDSLEVFKHQASFVDFINGVITKEGKIRYLSTNGIPLMDENGNLKGYRGTDTDITEKMNMEQLILEEKERFKATLLSVDNGVIATDPQGLVNVMNPVAEKLTGWTKKEAYGKPLEEVFILSKEAADPGLEEDLRFSHAKEIIREMGDELLLISKTGEKIPVESSTSPVTDKNGNLKGNVIVFRDYTEKREKLKEIEFLTMHDSLTGLYNRWYMEDSLKRLDTSRNLPLTIMIIDVNGLKLVNDAFGHVMGDVLLKTVANIIRKACRWEDIIGRIGGDEFLVLLPKTDGTQAQKIRARIEKAAQAEKLDSLIISVAVGYSVKSSEKESAQEIMVQADNMMYRNKLKHGKTMRSQTIETVLRNINFKYDQEQIHTERVAQYGEAIAKAMNFPEKEILDIKNVGVLHDIGKIMVPPEILNKKEKLTKDEYEIIKRHPETSYQILKSVDEYSYLAELVLHHHESWDGSGYPAGLKGKEIPLISRIITVADAFEAMTAIRPYQRTRTKEEALEELERFSGIQFDPDIVNIFVKLMGG